MATRRSTPLLLVAILAAELTTTASRAVNVSNTWFLPQEGFPVFYRYFRDRITWFEAEAVCQFHHGNLVTVDSSKQYDATRAYLKELDVVTNVWIGLKKKGPNDEFAWSDYKTLAQDGGYWQEQIPKSEAALCAVTDPAADFRWHSLSCGGPETASFVCELPVPPWARNENGCMLMAIPSLTVTYLPEQAAVELTSDCGLDGTRTIACKGQADRSEMIHQLSCDNGNESSHEADEEDNPVSASSSTLYTASDSNAGGTESHQPPTRHRRDADDVSPLLLRTPRSLSTEDGTNSTYSVTSTSSRVETVTMSTEIPEEINVTTQELVAPEVVSATGDVTLTGNSEQQWYTTTDPRKMAATKAVHTEQFITVTPYYTSVDLKHMVQKIVTEKPYQQQRTEEPGVTRSILSTPISTSPIGLPTVNTTAETSASVGVLNEIKEITVSLTEDVVKNNTGEMITKGEILSPETVSVSMDIFSIRNTTDSSSIYGNVSVPGEESTNSKESLVLTKNNAETDDQMVPDSEKENHQRKIPLVPLRGATPDRDEQTDENSNKSVSDWASNNEQQDEGEQIQPVETEPEVPARPNRGRRLIRPQSHSLYPYFLNRVLG